MGAALLGSLPQAASAENTISAIIAGARQKAKEDAATPSIWNWNSYKKPTGKYNYTDLQSFLPTLYLTKRAFETTLVQFDNPRVNASDPITYEVLRQQNRKEPTKLIRKDSFRVKMWLRSQKNSVEIAETEYERLKRAIDEEDTQCLILSRIEGKVEEAAIRSTKRNIEAVIDCIDQLLELLPADEQDTAKLVADTKTIEQLKLPMSEG